MPVFHEPRTGARATKLKQKENAVYINDLIKLDIKPGTLVIFPGYLEHEFVIDYGIDPFRFIHWNIQAVEKVLAKDI
jgi:hypothetical protein